MIPWTQTQDFKNVFKNSNSSQILKNLSSFSRRNIVRRNSSPTPAQRGRSLSDVTSESPLVQSISFEYTSSCSSSVCSLAHAKLNHPVMMRFSCRTQTDRHRQTDTETDTDTDAHRKTHTDTDRQTDTHTHTHTQKVQLAATSTVSVHMYARAHARATHTHTHTHARGEGGRRKKEGGRRREVY